MKKILKKALLKIPKIKKHYDLLDNLNKLNCDLNDTNQALISQNLSLIEENNSIKKKYFELNQTRYKYILSNIKKKVRNGIKIKVCFFVMFDSVFSAEPLFKQMLKEPMFDPFIVIIPDISRGEDHLIFSFNSTFCSLSKKYKKVYKGYDIKSKKIKNFQEKTDLICFSTPYEGITLKFFEINHFLKKDILIFYINYAYSVLKYVRNVTKLDSYSLFWKVFVENKFNIKELKNYQYLKGKNAVISGYCKVDDLSKQRIKNRKRKTIIIAPHHTVSDWKPLKISNFLKYSKFFLKLPTLYPQIDFIFRPHPLLITQLKKTEIWGENKTQKYFNKMESYPNVIYSKGGDYFEMFINSDGIIHDCGSFLAEYLFTDNPTCYLLESEESIKKWFLPIGQKCLSVCYQAFKEKDIINFIENVIIKENDLKSKERINFVNSYLKINYPDSSKFILNYIKKILL